MCLLVKAFLKAGVITGDGSRNDTFTGTPQGGILSPLLANIALSALDEHFTRQWHNEMGSHQRRATRRKHGLANWRLIRYADDFVIVVSGNRGHAEALREDVAAVIAPLGLRLSAEKTRVVHIDQGFDFLGYNIRRQRKRGTRKQYVYTKPSKKAIQAIKGKVKDRTRRNTRHLEPAALIASIGRALRGWAHYFRYGVSSTAFHAIDEYAWHRIVGWLHRKHSRLRWQELRRRMFLPGTWKLHCDGVTFTGATSVGTSRYRYRGSNIPTPWTRPQDAPAS